MDYEKVMANLNTLETALDGCSLDQAKRRSIERWLGNAGSERRGTRRGFGRESE